MRTTIGKATRLLHRHAARLLRGAVHHLKGDTVNACLPPSGFQAAPEVLQPRLRFERGSAFETAVRVRNRGDCFWSSYGSQPIHLQARWLARDGQPLPVPVTALTLPRAVRPGQEIVVREPLRALRSLGNYRLEFDLRQGAAGLFSQRGGQVAVQDVFVDAPAQEDIDYHKHFASFDLDRDYWTVVGPTTRELYEEVARIKLGYMVDLGLTPDARVLDVGCGTGQLAGPLAGYLSARGGYFGVELAQAGVDFCRRRFPLPNFRFERSDMTSIPVHGESFDMIVFFSVFTHTYPAETTALLREARRLLAPNGLIFADLFTSPMVEDYAGNRGALEVGEATAERIFRESGLRATEVVSSPWEEYARRRFYRLTAG